MSNNFLAEYGIDENQIQEAGFKLPPEGRARFEIGDAKVQKGTKNKPGEQAFIITYQLSDADGDPLGKAEDRYVMKQDGKVTPRAQESLGYLDMRLKQLGFVNGLRDEDFTGPDALVGIRGSLRVEHTTNGERKFANVRDVEVEEGSGHEDDADNQFADDVPDDIAAPTKARAKRSRAAAKPKEEPAENPVAGNEDLWSED